MCLPWVLGTHLHPDPVKDQKHTLFPAPAYTCSHVFPQATSSRAWLTAALCSPRRELGEHGFAWGRQERQDILE